MKNMIIGFMLKHWIAWVIAFAIMFQLPAAYDVEDSIWDLDFSSALFIFATMALGYVLSLAQDKIVASFRNRKRY